MAKFRVITTPKGEKVIVTKFGAGGQKSTETLKSGETVTITPDKDKPGQVNIKIEDSQGNTTSRSTVSQTVQAAPPQQPSSEPSQPSQTQVEQQAQTQAKQSFLDKVKAAEQRFRESGRRYVVEESRRQAVETPEETRLRQRQEKLEGAEQTASTASTALVGVRLKKRLEQSPQQFGRENIKELQENKEILTANISVEKENIAVLKEALYSNEALYSSKLREKLVKDIKDREASVEQMQSQLAETRNLIGVSKTKRGFVEVSKDLIRGGFETIGNLPEATAELGSMALRNPVKAAVSVVKPFFSGSATTRTEAVGGLVASYFALKGVPVVKTTSKSALTAPSEFIPPLRPDKLPTFKQTVYDLPPKNIPKRIEDVSRPSKIEPTPKPSPVPVTPTETLTSFRTDQFKDTFISKSTSLIRERTGSVGLGGGPKKFGADSTLIENKPQKTGGGRGSGVQITTITDPLTKEKTVFTSEIKSADVPITALEGEKATFTFTKTRMGGERDTAASLSNQLNVKLPETLTVEQRYSAYQSALDKYSQQGKKTEYTLQKLREQGNINLEKSPVKSFSSEPLSSKLANLAEEASTVRTADISFYKTSGKITEVMNLMFEQANLFSDLKFVGYSESFLKEIRPKVGEFRVNLPMPDVVVVKQVKATSTFVGVDVGKTKGFMDVSFISKGQPFSPDAVLKSVTEGISSGTGTVLETKQLPSVSVFERNVDIAGRETNKLNIAKTGDPTKQVTTPTIKPKPTVTTIKPKPTVTTIKPKPTVKITFVKDKTPEKIVSKPKTPLITDSAIVSGARLDELGVPGSGGGIGDIRGGNALTDTLLGIRKRKKTLILFTDEGYVRQSDMGMPITESDSMLSTLTNTKEVVITKPETAVITKTALSSEIKTNTVLKEKVKIRTEIITAQKSKQKLGLAQITVSALKQELIQASALDQLIKQDIITVPNVITTLVPKTTQIIVPKIIPRLIPKPVLEEPPLKPPRRFFRFQTTNRGFKQELGFDVFVKRKGTFIKETSNPLPRQKALGLGGRLVERSSAATFKLVPRGLVSTRDQPRKTNDFRSERFRPPKRGGDFNTFIEKNKFRINTFEEVEQISKKGQQALRINKGRKVFGF